MNRYQPEWKKTETIRRVRYICGYCGTDTTPSIGWYSDAYNEGAVFQGYIAICNNCNQPSFVDVRQSDFLIRSITPSAKMGKEIEGLPDDVATLYDEARKCSSASAYTAAVLTCRKILMHVAVEKGASSNKGFFEYVQYLADKNYIHSDGHDWVDYIRTKSNEANHEIQVMVKEDAEDLITFTEMLLRLVYEFKNRLAKKSVTP